MGRTRLSPSTDQRYVTSQKNEGPRSWVVTNTEEIVFRVKRDDGGHVLRKLLGDEALKRSAMVALCCTKHGHTGISPCLSQFDVEVRVLM